MIIIKHNLSFWWPNTNCFPERGIRGKLRKVTDDSVGEKKKIFTQGFRCL
jgi:hypothetical protein